MLGLLNRIRTSLWAGYVFPLPACLLAWAGHLALYHAGATNTPYLPFFLALVATTVIGGIGPGLLTVALTEAIAWGLAAHLHSPAPLVSGNLVAITTLLSAALFIILLTNFGTTAAIKLDAATRELRAINESLESRILERSAALLVAEENLRQAQKMEAVGQLTGGIAHDFNNLLTGIMGSLERLQARLASAPPEELARYITAAQDASTRAANLTNRLLTFSRRQPLTPRGTDLGRLITGMAELIGRSISPSIQLETPASPGQHAVLADPNQLEHALLNLCINASDAMPNGGILRIATAAVTLPADEAAALDLRPGDYITLTVADTGIGMTPEIQSRIFDPFFTTKPVGQGTGLGLSMIQGFTSQSGGATEVLSIPGEGTAVTLYLPRHHGQVDIPAAQLCPPPAACPGLGECILLVDDEPSIRLLAAEVLEEQGYTVHQAADAEAALTLLRDNQRLDVMITDLGLPGIGGRELAQTGLTLRPGLKILYITGYGDRGAPHHAPPPSGALLSKPFTMAALAARVQEMLSA